MASFFTSTATSSVTARAGSWATAAVIATVSRAASGTYKNSNGKQKTGFKARALALSLSSELPTLSGQLAKAFRSNFALLVVASLDVGGYMGACPFGQFE